MVAEDERGTRSKAPLILACGILFIAIATTVVAVVGYYQTADELVPSVQPIQHEGLPPGVIMPE